MLHPSCRTEQFPNHKASSFLEELKAKHVTASDLSSTAHQVHVQRPPRDLRRIIDLVAKYVAQMGEQFEEALRHSLRDQRREVKDELVFLKADPDSAEAQYYRWRVFSFAQGDTRQKWRSEPFQKGLVWHPPPKRHAGGGGSASRRSFYTAWSQINELFSVKTSEVFDAGSAAFESLFHAPPPPPPPPPSRPRSAPYWNLSAAVPEERAEHNSLTHWTNRVNPAAKPAVADVVQKAGVVPTPKDSSLWYNEPDATLEGDAPQEACDEMPESQPKEEPNYCDLSNLRVYGSMPGIPMSFTISEYNEREPPFSPASTICYAKQAPVSDSPASTVYCHGRQAPAFEAPLPEYDGKVLPREPCDFPWGIAVDNCRSRSRLSPGYRRAEDDFCAKWCLDRPARLLLRDLPPELREQAMMKFNPYTEVKHADYSKVFAAWTRRFRNSAKELPE
eukprot:s5868_g2.t2